MTIRIAFLLVFHLSFFITASARADIEEKVDQVIEDEQKIAQIGPQRGNFVLVPIPVSNPTVGTGLLGVAMYLHPKPQGAEEVPNDTSGIGALYTNNDTWFVGGFHNASWDNDRYRFMGAIGKGRLVLRYYGTGSDVPADATGIEYIMNISLASAQLQTRLPGTEDWFAGFRYVYMESENVFDLSNIFPNLPPTEINIPLRSGGLGLLLTYDSRNDNYYPTRGQYLQLGVTDFNENWGGDLNFRKSTNSYSYYYPFTDKTVLALRARLETSSDTTPFFYLSTLDMRGFSRSRYMAKFTLSTHAELRHKFTNRWGMIAFMETGWFADQFSDLSHSRTILSYGAGLRWQATKDKPLNLGLDAAISTDERAILIQIGEKF